MLSRVCWALTFALTSPSRPSIYFPIHVYYAVETPIHIDPKSMRTHEMFQMAGLPKELGLAGELEVAGMLAETGPISSHYQ